MLNNPELETARHQILKLALSQDGKVVLYSRPAPYARIGSTSFKHNLRERKLYVCALDELVRGDYLELIESDRNREVFEMTYAGILLTDGLATTAGSVEPAGKAERTNKAESPTDSSKSIAVRPAV
jgi:hypothetical protein